MPETQRRDVCQVVVVDSLTLLTGPIDDIADFDGIPVQDCVRDKA